MKQKTWYVYMITNQKGHLYTGITTDLKRRLNEHLNSPSGAKFFHFGQAQKIVFSKKCNNRSEASKLEARIKKMSRKKKLDLVGVDGIEPPTSTL